VDGEQLNIVPLAKARELAHAARLDLVIMSEKSDPPVVRIMDFGKLQYEQKKNLKAQRKNASAQKLKEVKFHMNIDTHDYEFKLKHGIDFLQKGCRLKVTLVLRGREMAHKELADELFDKIISDLAPYGEPDGKPKMLGRNLSTTFSLIKTTRRGGGSSKEGGGNKDSDSGREGSGVENTGAKDSASENAAGAERSSEQSQ